MPILYLTEADVRGLLTMDLALNAVETAFRKWACEEAQNVSRQRCQTDYVMLHVLPAAAKTMNAIGLKAYTTGRFGARFHVYLFDPKNGDLSAILEADHLGAVRTGAATGVATQLLARPEATTVGLFGTGKQARTQLEAVCKVRRIRRAVVVGRDAARLVAFCDEMSSVCGTEVTPAASPEQAGGQEVVITATSSREPVLFGQWLSAGAHVNLIGSNFPSKAEADVEVFRRATLVSADSKEQARTEAGDFLPAIDAGALHLSDVKDLAPLLVGRYPGRQSATDITVFKSLGLGLEDVAVAARVVALARQHGVGKHLLEHGTE
ncbi:MAG: ornithine cyclodeaminase family protein [Fimbriiglobus sp.]|jgi:ornithine cyclodeaminase/alanine dehydrogenase-like protein (mu-crystallin family)|nr:ornithine cyclodeaminase family protein [Fimbriiglobus sp.]